jgi:hypothetical protein
MTLKNAALLALIGTVLMTALLVWTFVFNFAGQFSGADDDRRQRPGLPAHQPAELVSLHHRRIAS